MIRESSNLSFKPSRIEIKNKLNISNTILFKEEIIDLWGGVLRLIDWTCLTSSNSSSILFPPNYKPSLK